MKTALEKIIEENINLILKEENTNETKFLEIIGCNTFDNMSTYFLQAVAIYYDITISSLTDINFKHTYSFNIIKTVIKIKNMETELKALETESKLLDNRINYLWKQPRFLN